MTKGTLLHVFWDNPKEMNNPKLFILTDLAHRVRFDDTCIQSSTQTALLDI